MMSVTRSKLRVYRSRVSLVLMLVISTVLLLVGLSILTVDSGTGNLVFGSLWLVFSVALGSLALTERLVVSDWGLEFRHNFRTKSIPWSAINTFGVGKSRSLIHWPCLVINSSDGYVMVGSLSGSNSFVKQIASELESKKREISEPEKD